MQTLVAVSACEADRIGGRASAGKVLTSRLEGRFPLIVSSDSVPRVSSKSSVLAAGQ